jgi:predicted nucleic-acid-binding Zn-ribbon protein
VRDTGCPKCGSSEIIVDAEVRDYDANYYRNLSAHVPLRTPAGGFFKKTSESSELRAWICGGCGYTELYATNFRDLLRANQ